MKKTKSVWIKADGSTWEENKPRVTTGLESGADTVFLNAGDIPKVRELGNIKIAAPSEDADIVVVGKESEGDGTTKLPADFANSEDIAQAQHLTREGKTVAGYVVIKNKKYEQFAVELGKSCDYLVVIGTDWKVIPLENLIAGLQKLDVEIIAGVQNSEEAKLALETLEHGSDGVLLDTDNLSEIKKVTAVRDRSGMENIPLVKATVTKVKPVGMGDRVCVDTASLMVLGEGMLIGSQSNGLFLVHSESEESPYVAARPFRVNAGAVHAYIRVGEKTRYLSELASGDEVLIVDSEGETRPAVVGRVKIERRPLMLVEAEVEGTRIKTLLQNAETIKLVGSDGKPVPVTALKEGDEVMVYFEATARHFGIKIEETIIEK
ncbi:MAG: 3-dehydroquinate synthase [Candidatus Methanoperedens nitroreducens]|uniref:3-dehydroquinate synthase n=1 Tax=Candidatus Methanoperedens nitratireducens TaxID=1392998 RepID=A0A0P7ZDV7_9EURY|nr:3-dehydroquinate synthase II [Candidatus Methanoperedens sp. BLZ2]KAB2944691.1 MAG: 3-dehydroquinate synthase II [Candidatus Methanoperedens sp.]KPQ41688.1 MAG: 3-dehydroquinate synthase [Candidatus Methanoperedens sp. BLZ1]MBZ0175882.1 3-dehydroquinate synthase II [Candidatus Methanoperedens nitroreducens]CAG0950273.1 3-dehydroquinate synthase II [Methanosarcinales archaeon]MCX9076394.1 3-dehydroquinate synthase II [Candidatus Methanoperedens sp.]